MNLQSGINIGSWRLRDNSTWSYYSGSSNSSDSNKWQHINTSAERDIIPLRSRLTVGDSYTDGDIFDSVNFRGLKINSTEAMLPDSQHGFAPVIHGIARGTAQVSVKQNGYDVYQTTVPPGPFTIDDINSAANGGDLQVTIKEADGSIQTLYVPYSSVPVLQRAGYTRYALAMGEYRSGNNLQSSPKFIQGSLMHGLEGNWTPYGGMQIAEDYQAFNLGIGKDLGLFGAFSFDITQANTTLADGTRHSGQSVKSVYSKSFYQTGTNIQVAGYRYSTQGFYNLSDSAYSRMSGYTVKPPTGDSNEQTQFIDYFNLFYSKRGQEQISISQQLGNYGTTFFSASRQSYWNTSRSDQQISFGLNVPFGDITTSLNYSYSNNIWQNDRDHLLAFTLNVPFSHWMRTDSQSTFRNSNASYSMSNDLKGGMTNLSGVYGTLLPDNNLNFTVDLQKNSARQFPTTGSTSPAVPFQITLSECSKGTTGVRVAFNGIEDAENNTLLKLDEGSNTASGLGIEILDGNMRPVKLNDLHAGMQWIPLVPEQNNILPYSARLKSTQKSVNPGLVRASATFTLEFQ
ncbi:fimbria/pilus outer membrane usher protein [Escherichia coli]|uniref:fimbria/pilus outer membrane usher protein n=1 Tax=Escherichia coli TaxID=562 RepID=UPI0025863A25|nr:fimbria/pilus outer membrane usher protein [Escherichia coli]